MPAASCCDDGSLPSFFVFVVFSVFFLIHTEGSAVEMWESRGLCEISKSLWEALLAFHRDGISIAVVVVARRLALNPGGCGTLADLPFVVPGASYAVVVDRPRHRRAHRRRLGSRGPWARARPDDFGAGAGGFGRERSVR